MSETTIALPELAQAISSYISQQADTPEPTLEIQPYVYTYPNAGIGEHTAQDLRTWLSVVAYATQVNDKNSKN